MCQELAKAFVEKLKRDETFRDTVVMIENVEEKLEYINQEGFIFTSDELDIAASSILDYNY
ncbi:MAG: Nif11-like leader peptide family natural product precursor [Chlorobium sp.]|nr:MAG: Nif11-like leader peptide family natural product precursor [Chlorobium sp.]